MGLEKELSTSSSSFGREEIEIINKRFKDEVPLGSKWTQRSVIPGLPNILTLSVLSYENEGYKIKAFYDSGRVKESIIPYERFSEWYVPKK